LRYYEFTDEETQEFHSIISKNIKNIRKQKKITQLELALAMGYKSVSTISKIEAGLENNSTM